jgi:hypothetical protein
VTEAKRILYVHNSADIYGASRSLLRLLAPIRQRGYHPIVLLPEDGPLRERIADLGIKTFVDPWLSVIDQGTAEPRRLAALTFGFPASVRNLAGLVTKNGSTLCTRTQA